MRAFLALVFSVAAAAESPPPVAPEPQPPITVPERSPDAAHGAPKPDLSPKPKPEEPIRPDVRTVAGEIGSVEWSEHRFTLEAADGPLAVHVDRNTLVFLESQLGTVRDLYTGLPVRVGLEGAQNLATWVEVRPPGTTATPGKPEQPGAAVAPPVGTAPGGSDSKGREPPTPLPPSATPPGSPPGPGPVPGPR
jgi:hypothetical protein